MTGDRTDLEHYVAAQLDEMSAALKAGDNRRAAALMDHLRAEAGNDVAERIAGQIVGNALRRIAGEATP